MENDLLKTVLLCIVINLCINFHSAWIPQDCPNYGEYLEKDEWFPHYHLGSPSGWMSDTNGLISFDGYYHVFFQHVPYSDFPWSFKKMSWGHARSKDMLKWEHLPVAISPKNGFEKDGVFSGCAVDDNGIFTLIYTGHFIDERGFGHQVQCVATSSDSVNFTKEGKVLDPPTHNPDFRDPKVWKVDDTWYMVLGFREGMISKVLLYKSPDLRNWKYQDVLITSENNLGFMLETPDLFKLGDKYVLMMSPQGIRADGFKYRNLLQSGYVIGNWSPGSNFDLEQHFREVDHGHDFYAPQSFLTADGRRIIIGWMGMWLNPLPEFRKRWAGMQTLPRELTLSDVNHHLRILPIREVEELRYNRTKITNTFIRREYVQIENNVRAMEIITTWNVTASYAEKYGVHLGDRGCSDDGVYVYYDNQMRRVVLDRHYRQYNITGYRSFPLENTELLTLRMFFDHSSLEVFINDGLGCMSSRIYPSKGQRYLYLFAENGGATLTESNRWLLL